MLVVLVFAGCATKVPDDQVLVHYYVELAQVGLTQADSVTLDYWVDGDAEATHLSLEAVSKTAVFDIQVDEGAQVSVRVSVYQDGAVVSTRLDQFAGGERGSAPDLVVFHAPISYEASILDTLDLFAPFAQLGMKSCALEAGAFWQDLGNCRVVFLGAGQAELRLRFTDESRRVLPYMVGVAVTQGEPTLSLAVSKADAGIAESLTFTATASDLNGGAPDGRITQYEWDFDSDGVYETITTSGTVTYAYPDAYENHAYTAQVRVTDDDGNTVAATQVVTVDNRAPVIGAINVSQNPVGISKPSVLQVNASDFSDPDGNEIASITWSFSDGRASRTLGRSDTLWLVRAIAGTVMVTATVQDKYGITASKSTAVVVSEGAVNAGTGDVVTVVNAKVPLAPTVSFELGQTLASCRWNINGVGFGASSSSCATTLTMPATPYSDYTAEYEATSDVGTQTMGVIHILVRDGIQDPRDGEIYPVLTYNYDGADHTWMAENLNYSGHKGNNLGVAGKTYTIGWCYGVGGNDTAQHQNSVTCDNGYGRLYRWNDAMGFPDLECNSNTVGSENCPHSVAAKHQGICPSGWHVPSDEEWTNFTDFMEAQDPVADNAGGWLKAVVEAGNTSWNNKNFNQQDPLGFSALPAGRRDDNGYWYGRAGYAYFWSASEGEGGSAWRRGLNDYNASVSRYSGSEYNGYSLRCLKD